MSLLSILCAEQRDQNKGGIYHYTQIKLAYNSNRIEGSQLSENQTRYIFDTRTIFFEEGETTANVDDIVETVNHFGCFDYMLNIAHEPLTEEHIKRFHALLKMHTSDSGKSWFRVGDYKQLPNTVGMEETVAPADVPKALEALLIQYHQKKAVSFEDVIDFHHGFEKIHPFQDGNGRVGRLIVFKECLYAGWVPAIIEEEFKFFYYRGLSEYPRIQEYLLDTFRSAQDRYQKALDYFFPDGIPEME